MNNTKQKSYHSRDRIFALVEVTGLEPAASASRTQRSTKLSHTSISSAKADECYYSESTPKSQGVFKFTSKMQVRITLNNPTITK